MRLKRRRVKIDVIAQGTHLTHNWILKLLSLHKVFLQMGRDSLPAALQPRLLKSLHKAPNSEKKADSHRDLQELADVLLDTIYNKACKYLILLYGL